MRGLILYLILCVHASATVIAGTVTGFAAPSTSYLVLVLNNKTYRIVPANATSYRFNTIVPNGTPYSLRVGIQPANMSCTLLNMDVTCVTLTSATVYWTQPTMNTDGTVLTDLTGYVLYYGTDPTLTVHASRIIPAPTLMTTVSNLLPNTTYYFSIASISASGGVGPRSNFARIH